MDLLRSWFIICDYGMDRQGENQRFYNRFNVAQYCNIIIIKMREEWYNVATVKFTKDFLMDELDLPYSAIEDKVLDNSRWSIFHEIIFEH